MKRVAVALTSVALAGAAIAAGAVSAQESTKVQAKGCVEPGIEARCLMVKDAKSGTLYNLLVKEPRPSIGDGIEFSGVRYNGLSYCMQGVAVEVAKWSRKDSLKCTQGDAPKK